MGEVLTPRGGKCSIHQRTPTHVTRTAVTAHSLFKGRLHPTSDPFLGTVYDVVRTVTGQGCSCDHVGNVFWSWERIIIECVPNTK